MKKINKKLTRSVMAMVLGGVMGMGVLMPRVEAANVDINPSADDKLNQVSNNSVVVGKRLDGTAADKFAYAYNGTTAAETAKWSLTGTDVWGDIYGGYSEAASVTVSGNTVTISGDVQITDITGIYGGYVDSGTGSATNNKVVIRGGTLTGCNEWSCIWGGASDCDAIDNTLEISGDAQINAMLISGAGSAGHTEHNKITINGGTLTDVTISGGYGNVHIGNVVEITGEAKITFSSISGGYVDWDSESGDVYNNKVTISGGILKGAVESAFIAGGIGYSSMGGSDAIGNSVEISGDAQISNVYIICGGAGSVATGNSVEISDDAQIADISGIYGGYVSSDGGSATNNKVSISGGTLTGIEEAEMPVFVAGGRADGGEATGNSVEISGDAQINDIGWITGGWGAGDMNNNSVTISGGTFNKNVGQISGGFTSAGDAYNNKVSISGGTFADSSIFGGAAYDESGSYGDATANIVEISGDAQINGRGIMGAMGSDSAEYNKIIISGGTWTGGEDDITGGYGQKDAKSNKVSISGGTLTGKTDGFWLCGGEADDGDATCNIVEISGDTQITNLTFIIGGSTESGDSNRRSSQNEVTISGGTLTGTDEFCIFGGMSFDREDNSGKYTAKLNEVHIIGGTITTNAIIGGLAGGYKDGTFAEESSISAKENIVEIGGNAKVTVEQIYGGARVTEINNVDDRTPNSFAPVASAGSGNTLIIGTKDVSAGNVGGFENYTFAVPVGIAKDGSETMLNITGDTPLVIADTDTLTVNLGIWTTVSASSTITLIDSIPGFGSTNIANVTKKAVKGNNEYDSTFAITDGTDSQQLLKVTVGVLTKYVDVIPDEISGNNVVVTGGTTATINGEDAPAFKAGVGTETVWQNAYGGYNEGHGVEVKGNTITVTATGNAVEQEVYGGYSKNGVAGGTTAEDGNEVIFNSDIDFTTGAIFGGCGGSAAGYNKVTIGSDSTVTLEGGVLGGGFAEAGSAFNNKVSINGGTLTCGVLLGGFANCDVTGNSVEISGGAQITDCYMLLGGKGGYGVIDAGSANNNKVTISDSTLDNCYMLCGGFTDAGDAYYNKVSIINGNLTGSDVSIVGGYGVVASSSFSAGCAMGNIVEISGDTKITSESGAIWGGYGPITNDNKIIISGGTWNGLMEIKGGFGNESANNKVSISGGILTGPEVDEEDEEAEDSGLSVYGGYGTSEATGNIVEISGETTQITDIDGIYGGYSDSEAGSAFNNKVSINGGTLTGSNEESEVYGGKGSVATGNTVEISGETTQITDMFGIIGGWGEDGEANNNRVTISGGTLGFEGIVGGYSDVSNANNNRVTITGGILSCFSIMGGGQDGTDEEGSASNNTILIKGGNFEGLDMLVGGGYLGDTNNNKIIISGGTLKSNEGIQIFAGWGLGTNNTVAILDGELHSYIMVAGAFGNNNTIEISDKVKWVKEEDEDAFELGGADSTTGNTLIVDGKDIAVSGVYNTDHYLYCIPAGIDDETPMLNNDIAITLAGTDTIIITADQSTPDTVILANNVELAENVEEGTVPNLSYDLCKDNIITGGGIAISESKLVYTMGTIAQWINVQPTALNYNTVVVDGSKDGSNNPLATVNGGTQTFVAGTSDKTEWQNVYGGYSGVNGAVVTANTVNISGTATVEGNVYGGYSATGAVLDNTVNIQGGEIKGNVYGGYTTDDVLDNTINWSAGIIRGSEIKANNINITGTAAQYLGAAVPVTADAATVLGDGTNAASFTVGNGTDASVLTFASGLDAKAQSVLNIQDVSGVTLQGTSTLAGTVSGAGKLIVDGTTTATAEAFTQTGGLEVLSTRELILTGENKELGQAVNGDGKVVINGKVRADADRFTQTGGLEVLSTKELILTGDNKTLGQAVSGAGKVVIDGTISAAANKFTQTGGLEVQDTLEFTSRGLDVTAVGGFTQTAGSNISVPASVIEADTNDAAAALFTGVDDAETFNVSGSNLTLTGTVQEGKYYVLVAGTAVDGTTLTDASLWNIDNITVEGMFSVEYNTNLTGNSIAVQVFNATSYEEINTSGLAAVQQGALAVSKEFTGEVENHLGFMNKPSLKGDKAKVRDVASTNKDNYTIETVEQGNANEVMPVQVEEKDKYEKEIWANYIRTKETTEGMKLGAGLEGNNTAQYNGAVVGVDFYSSRKAVAGVAFSYTVGDIDSYSGNTFTRNKSKYYGVSFYDRVTNGNTALIYDIGYIRGDNDISQFYGKETTADVKTDTYTAGVRYEAEFGTEKSRVVPFASFRYMRQNNKDYTNSHNTGFEAKNQNLYIPKVGIAWTGEFVMPQSAWIWRPTVEAGYVWNLGDRSVDSNVLIGTNISSIEYDTVDKSSYYARAGMEFINRNFTAGLFYRYLKGDKVRNNKWNVNMSWKF